MGHFPKTGHILCHNELTFDKSLFIFIYLKDWKRTLPPADSLSKCLPQPRPVGRKSAGWNSTQVSHTGGRQPWTSATGCCVPGCVSREAGLAAVSPGFELTLRCGMQESQAMVSITVPQFLPHHNKLKRSQAILHMISNQTGILLEINSRIISGKPQIFWN